MKKAILIFCLLFTGILFANNITVELVEKGLIKNEMSKTDKTNKK